MEICRVSCFPNELFSCTDSGLENTLPEILWYDTDDPTDQERPGRLQFQPPPNMVLKPPAIPNGSPNVREADAKKA